MRILVVFTAGVLFLRLSTTCQAADFACSAGDVACLINAIHLANTNGQANTISLATGTYALTGVDNISDGPNGLPTITGVLTISGATAAATSIEPLFLNAV